MCVTGTDREGLERLCRYVARPAIATERLSELPDGRIAYELRHPWSDGTLRVVFEPLSFLEKLAALIPPPGAHLVTSHGVLAPAAVMRRRILPAGAGNAGRRSGSTGGGLCNPYALGREVVGPSSLISGESPIRESWRSRHWTG